MKVACLPALIVVTVLLSGCYGLLTQAQSGSTGDPPANRSIVTKEMQDAVRKQEADQDEDDAEQQRTIRGMAERELIRGLKLALGQQPDQAAVTSPPERASKIIVALRQAGIKLRLDPVLDQDGNPMDNSVLSLGDSYSDRATQLSRKFAEHTATAAEQKEVQHGAKFGFKLNDLRSQIQWLSMAAYQSNEGLFNAEFGAIIRVSGLIRMRKLYEMQIDESDYRRVKGWLEQLRKDEQIAAASLGMLAAYQAVIGRGENPEMLDTLAEATLKAVQLKPTVSDAEAREYVSGFKGNVSRVMAEYESSLRKLYGDAKFERRHKAQFDATVRTLRDAEGQKSYTQLTLERFNSAPPSAIGASPGGTPTRPGSPADSSLPGGVSGVPALAVIKGSVEGIQALINGDTKGALKAAIGMVPEGGAIKQGLDVADSHLK